MYTIRDYAQRCVSEKLAHGGYFDQAVEIIDDTAEGDQKAAAIKCIFHDIAIWGRDYFDHAIKLTKSMIDPYRKEQIRRLFEIIVNRHGCAQAISDVQTIKDDITRGHALRCLSEILAAQRNSQAIEIAITQLDGEEKEDTLSYISKIFTEKGDFHSAELAAKNMTRWKKDSVLIDISKKLAENGYFDKAIEIVDTQVQADNSIARSRISEIFAKKSAEKGDSSTAIKIANALPEKNKHFALADISKILADNGDFDRAIEVANALPRNLADRVFELILTKNVKDSTLEYISSKLADKRQFEKAKKVVNTISENIHRQRALDF